MSRLARLLGSEVGDSVSGIAPDQAFFAFKSHLLTCIHVHLLDDFTDSCNAKQSID